MNITKKQPNHIQHIMYLKITKENTYKDWTESRKAQKHI